jgi:hypothetical protein
METPKPVEQHLWLQRLLGEWEGRMTGGEHPAWTESGRKLGELWVLVEGRGVMPDGEPSNTLMTLGYDTRTGKFVGSWVGSMMTHQWIYSGSLDASGKVLTLDSDGPSFEDPTQIARYQDIIVLKDDGSRELRSQTLQPDGTWKEFMVVTYTRPA